MKTLAYVFALFLFIAVVWDWLTVYWFPMGGRNAPAL